MPRSLSLRCAYSHRKVTTGLDARLVSEADSLSGSDLTSPKLVVDVIDRVFARA